jgi:hypothetical protein
MRILKVSKKAPWILVDDKDYYRLKAYFWLVKPSGRTSYAFRKNPSYSNHFNWNMAWDVIGKPKKGYISDHKDGNGVNNQEYNLRNIPAPLNAQNRHDERTSEYAGVNKSGDKWRARLTVDGTAYELGHFDSEDEAIEARKVACNLFGVEILSNEVKPPDLEPVFLDEADILRATTLMRKDGRSEEEVEAYRQEAMKELEEEEVRRRIFLMQKDGKTEEEIQTYLSS